MESIFLSLKAISDCAMPLKSHYTHYSLVIMTLDRGSLSSLRLVLHTERDLVTHHVFSNETCTYLRHCSCSSNCHQSGLVNITAEPTCLMSDQNGQDFQRN
jgi:hypothetical protein